MAATPEEQQAYEGVVMAASEVLYGEMNAEIMKMLEAEANNPPLAIARVATTVITQLDDQSGGTIPETVIFPAAAEIAELVAELADAKGIFPVDAGVMQVAGQHLVEMVAQQYDVSPEEIEQFMASVPPDVLEKVGAHEAAPHQQGAPANV